MGDEGSDKSSRAPRHLSMECETFPLTIGDETSGTDKSASRDLSSYGESFHLTIGETTGFVMEWLRSEMSGDLSSIPRMGHATAKCFKDSGIETTFALLGKFLLLKTEGCSSIEHCERFWIWLVNATENNRILKKDKAVICRCIFLKADILIPGLYDEEAYELGGGKSTK